MKTKSSLAVLLLLTSFALSAQEAKYEIKSGIIKKTMEMWGQKMEGALYFDDYGKIESTTFTMSMQGTNTQMRTINKDGAVTVINLENKTGNRFVLPEKPVNFLNLTQEIKDKHKVKELGEEDILGKSCKKYSMETSQMGQTVSSTVWIWKGIALKTVSSVNGMDISDTATDIRENAAVAADIFTVPGDVSIQEM